MSAMLLQQREITRWDRPAAIREKREKQFCKFWERAAWVVARTEDWRRRWDSFLSQASGTEGLSVARHLVNVVVCFPARDAR